MATHTGRDTISLGSLNRSLSLVLGPSEALAMTRSLEPVIEIHSEQLRRILQSAQFRILRRRAKYLVLRMAMRQPGSGNPAQDVRALATDGALLLSLHLGTGMTAGELAEVFRTSQAAISRALLDVRLRLLGRGTHSCKVFLDTLGSYRDGYYDLGLAAAMIRHRQRCAACSKLLSEIEQLDGQLTEEISREQFALNEQASSPPKLFTRAFGMIPILVPVVVLAIVLLVTSGLVAGITGRGSVPLFAGSDTDRAGEQGWIILGTWDGGLVAFDPVTGKRQTLWTERFTNFLNSHANYLLSPDGSRIALFAQSEVDGLHWATRSILVVGIDGELEAQVEWSDPDEIGWPTSWLNDRELLVVRVPAFQGEPADDYLRNVNELGRLKAVNVASGEQRTLYEGGVGQVLTSPDGRHIAMVRPYDPRDPGTTVDVWEITDGELGRRVASVDREFTWTGGLRWTPDGSGLVYGQIASFTNSGDTRPDARLDDEFSGEITQVNLVMLDPSGERRVLVENELGHAARIIGIANGSSQLVYEHFETPESSERSIWIKDLTDGEQRRLVPPVIASADPEGPQVSIYGPRRSSIGFLEQSHGESILLQFFGQHYLPSDAAFHQQPHGATYLTVYDEAGRPDVVSVLSARWNVTPLRWMGPEDFPGSLLQDRETPASMTAFDPVGNVPGYVTLDPSSRISPDISAIMLTEKATNSGRHYLWYPPAETGRWVAQRTTDLTWTPDGHAILGVTELSPSGRDISRITQHSSSQRGGSSVDGFLDPANLRDREDLRYAYPATAPSGGRTSFYVVDSSSGRAGLWVGDIEHGVREVHRFRHTSRTARLSPLNGVWIDDHTFLFSEATEWIDSLPARTTLKRLTVNDGGSVTIDRLIELEPRGRDRGVSIFEFDISPDQKYLAYRLRHFRSRDDASDAYDSIQLSLTANLDDRIEIHRGERSEGLVWSPSGHALAVGDDPRVGIYFIDDHRLEFVEHSRRVRYPVWVNSSELWVALGSRSEAEIYRVRLQ